MVKETKFFRKQAQQADAAAFNALDAELEADLEDDDPELIARIVVIGAALDDTLDRVNLLILEPRLA